MTRFKYLDGPPFYGWAPDLNTIDVTDWGAVGDGVTDNTDAITKCIAVVVQQGGGTVYFPGSVGAYMTRPFVHPAEVILEGDAPIVSVVKLIAGSNADLCVTEGFLTNTGTTNNGPQGFGLRNLTLDANGANQAASAVARPWVVYGYNYFVDHVWFVGGRAAPNANGVIEGGGPYSEWGGTANPMESLWANFKVWDYMGEGAKGVDWNGPHDSQMRGFVIATLNSSIRPFTAALYGTTPFNGTTLTVPSNAKNGGSGSFTFATTVAADPAVFPPTGGSFMVPTHNQLATYAIVTYASSATVGAVTTFSGCQCAAPANVTLDSNAAIAQVTSGLSINGGASGHGESNLQMMNGHIWGRNHFGIRPNGTPYQGGNMEVEGAFMVNVIIASKTIFTGVVYGSNGQANQVNESGIVIGTAENGAGGSYVNAIVYNVGNASSTNGYSLGVYSSTGGGEYHIAGTTAHPTNFGSGYAGSSDYYEASCQNQPLLSCSNDYRTMNRVQQQLVTFAPIITYSASMTPDVKAGSWQKITATNATPFTINAPTVALPSNRTTELVIEISNTSGGALGTVTWNAIFKFAGLTWTSPATGFKRYAVFQWNGVNWICTSIATADY